MVLTGRTQECGRVVELTCTRIFFASHKNVSCLRNWKSNSRLKKIGSGSSFSRPVFCRYEGDNLCTMSQSVRCLFHVKSCHLSDGEKSSVLLTI